MYICIQYQLITLIKRTIFPIVPRATVMKSMRKTDWLSENTNYKVVRRDMSNLHSVDTMVAWRPKRSYPWFNTAHPYSDVIMSTMASEITSVSIVYSTVCSAADQRKHQISTSLAFVKGIHQSPVNSRTKVQERGNCFHLMTSSYKMRTLCVLCFAVVVSRVSNGFGNMFHGCFTVRKSICMAWISNYIRNEVWGVIMHPSQTTTV